MDKGRVSVQVYAQQGYTHNIELITRFEMRPQTNGYFLGYKSILALASGFATFGGL